MEQGAFSYQRGVKAQPVRQRVVKSVEGEQSRQAEEMVGEPAKQDAVIPAMYLVARAAAQDMAHRLEERERSRLPYIEKDFETDVDNIYPKASTGAAREISKNTHLVARQAALQYVQRLQHAGKLLSRDSIPRALRDGRSSGWFKEPELDDLDL